MTVTLERPTTTQAPEPTACPDGLSWCLAHEVDTDGFVTHRTATVDISADALGIRTLQDVPVLDAYAAIAYEEDGTPDPAVWLSAKYPLPKFVYPEDGFGFSPARAREVGLLLVQLGGALDGSVVTPVPRYAPGTFPCDAGVPWCNDEAASSDEDHTTCWSGEQYLPATGGTMPDGKRCGAQYVAVLLGQDIRNGVRNEPTICLNVAYDTEGKGESDDAEMTLDEAEQLALYLLAQVAMLRGSEVR